MNMDGICLSATSSLLYTIPCYSSEIKDLNTILSATLSYMWLFKRPTACILVFAHHKDTTVLCRTSACFLFFLFIFQFFRCTFALQLGVRLHVV